MNKQILYFVTVLGAVFILHAASQKDAPFGRELEVYPDSFEWHEEALQDLQSRGKPHGHILERLGYAYAKANDRDKALNLLEQAVSRLKIEGGRYGFILGDIASIYARNKDWDNAIESFKQAVEALQREHRYEIGALTDLGLSYVQKEDWVNAEEVLNQVLTQPGESRCGFLALNGLGYICEKKNDINNACYFYQRALQDRETPVFPVINMLYVFATYPDVCWLTHVQARKYAIKLLEIPADNEKLISYQTSYPERFARAREEAERLWARGVVLFRFTILKDEHI